MRPTRALLALAAVLLALPTLAPSTAAATGGPAPLAPGAVRRSTAEIVGYLPAWEMTSEVASSLRLDLLTTIALFEVPVRSDGSLDRSSWAYRAVTGDMAAGVIRRAHAAGVRVVLTFTSFGQTANHALLSRAAARARLVSEAVALVAAEGADGIDLDIEGIGSSADVAGYGRLVRSLATAERKANRAARVSIATQASVAGARLAATAVANGADRVFMMAYEMRTASAATAGSVDPFDRRASSYAIVDALDAYLTRGVPAGRIVLGVPFFGMVWQTSGPSLNAPPRGTGSVVLASRLASTIGAGATVARDPLEGTPRWTWYDRSAKTWKQAYLDDAIAIGARASLTRTRGLAGLGLWALGYERGQPGYWAAIATAMALDITAPALGPVSLTWDRAGRRWVARWSGSDTGSGVARYRVVYRIGSGPYRTLAGGLTMTAPITASRRAVVRVAVQVFDRAGNASRWAYVRGRP